MIFDERIEQLIAKYLKHYQLGQRAETAATLRLIKDTGGYAAWDEAIRRADTMHKDKV
jgi:hypothetical protein